MNSRLFGTMCACILSLVISSTNAAVLPLEGRLPATPGGTDYQAYYDPNLDITWAADANIVGTGKWEDQVALVAGLNIGGVTGWRLPSMDVNGDGTVVECGVGGGGVTGCSDNEMGYLFWEEGIQGYIANTNYTFFGGAPEPFTNILPFQYWSSTEVMPDPFDVFSAWIYRFDDANQFEGLDGDTSSAWAVHSGDVSAVPVPAAVWLFGSGLLGLVGMARRKKTT